MGGEVSAMRRWMIFVLVLLLAGAGLWFGCTRSASPPSAEGATSMAALGLVLLDSEEGVSVLAVKDKSPAEYAGIHPGDLLLQANGHPFSTILQLEALLPPAKQSALQLQLMRRQQDVMTVQLHLR